MGEFYPFVSESKVTLSGVPRALDIGGLLGYNEICVNAAMAELADAMDLGSIGRPCRFESC